MNHRGLSFRLSHAAFVLVACSRHAMDEFRVWRVLKQLWGLNKALAVDRRRKQIQPIAEKRSEVYIASLVLVIGHEAYGIAPAKSRRVAGRVRLKEPQLIRVDEVIDDPLILPGKFRGAFAPFSLANDRYGAVAVQTRGGVGARRASAFGEHCTWSERDRGCSYALNVLDRLCISACLKQDLAIGRNQNVMGIGWHAKALCDVGLLVGVDLSCDYNTNNTS